MRRFPQRFGTHLLFSKFIQISKYRGKIQLARPLSEQPQTRLTWANNSEVQGVPKGADQIRQPHPTLVLFDEAAHLDEFQAAYGNADLVSTQVIAISSAGPSWFGEVCER